MSAVTGGSALVAALETHGVDTVFGIPGTHNLAIYAALARSPIRPVLTRHEQGAGYAADGYARVSGMPGVCLTTTGPAILNAAAAAAQAWSDSVPVLFISPGMPLAHPSFGNGYLHEVKDQHSALTGLVAYSQRVTSVAEIPSAVAYAFAAMCTGRPRPVHLEIPLDLLDATAEVRDVAPISPAIATPSGASVEEAATALRSAQRPVLIAGGGARAASAEVGHVAELLNAPVITTANGKGVLDESHPLSVGAGLHHASARALLDDADVVLAVGTELAPSDLWNGPIDLDAKLIRVDIDARSIITNADARVRVVGDAAVALDQLMTALGPVAATTDDARAHASREALMADAATEGAPWTGIINALAPLVERHTVVAGDSTMTCYYGALTGLRIHRPGGFLYPTGGGTLGYGLPAAIGASMTAERPRVVALLGDGGTMFTLPELATAAALGLPLPVIVVDNGGYGEIAAEMAGRGDAVHSVQLGGVDFAAAACAMGCHGRSLEASSELSGAVQDAWASDRPTVLHIREGGG